MVSCIYKSQSKLKNPLKRKIYREQPFNKYISFKKMRSVASNKRAFKKQPSKKQIYIKKFFVHNIKMLKLSLNELKQIAKMRGIKGYKSMSEERLISSINESEPVKESEKNFNDTRIEKIKKDFY